MIVCFFEVEEEEEESEYFDTNLTDEPPGSESMKARERGYVECEDGMRNSGRRRATRVD